MKTNTPSYWQNEQVVLRAMEPEDWQAGFDSYYDSDARRMLQYQLELPITEKKAQSDTEYFSHFNQESGRLMFTILNKEGDIVGAVNLNSIDERNGLFSIGMQISSGHRAKGYGTAAMKILLDYAFNERRLHKFNVSVIDYNIGSATMLQKVGCQKEGVRREVIYMKGKHYDEVLYGLTATEFNQKHHQRL